MKYYMVHGYREGDIETEYEGKSLKKAYSVFNSAKKRYPEVRIDEWKGTFSEGSFDGDYVNDIEHYKKGA